MRCPYCAVNTAHPHLSNHALFALFFKTDVTRTIDSARDTPTSEHNDGDINSYLRPIKVSK